MKQKRINVKVVCVIETGFYEYPTATANKRALAQIKRCIRDGIGYYIPISVEKNPDVPGAYFEDTTTPVKCKIKVTTA